jgi:hypothetical protein
MSREGRSRWDFGWRWSSHFVIGKPGDPMMHRWRLIQTPWFGVYVHFIFREDLDNGSHDHPWQFWSLVLSGGYTEELHLDPRDRAGLVVPLHVVSRWTLHHFPLHRAHRITSVRPGTTTLCVVGRKLRVWGFYDEHQWVDYRDALRLRPTEGIAQKRPAMSERTV